MSQCVGYPEWIYFHYMYIVITQVLHLDELGKNAYMYQMKIAIRYIQSVECKIIKIEIDFNLLLIIKYQL